MNLCDKYRPKRLSDLRGQNQAVTRLSRFVKAPSPCAFLFAGDTGVGKSCAALALAAEIGCAVDQQEFGGLYQIASGEQSADGVRECMRRLWNRPFYGNGWKVLIVNECDHMSTAAQIVWLDALENLPGHTVVIFTTNAPEKLPDRFKDRCETVTFESSWEVLKPIAEKFAFEIWQAETGLLSLPAGASLKIVRDGKFSFRRLLQQMSTLTACAGEAVAA
jgi:DNA polymerase III gamma/tau subunit